uniref:DUF4276 family protein n=1 Tax=Prevotella sp. TaxID=59823 RepID=UPI004026BECB
MKRLIIVCEGPTEQEFCLEVLGVELAKRDVYVEAPLIKHSHGGIVAWEIIKRQILKHLQEGDAFVSMWWIIMVSKTNSHSLVGKSQRV